MNHEERAQRPDELLAREQDAAAIISTLTLFVRDLSERRL